MIERVHKKEPSLVRQAWNPTLGPRGLKPEDHDLNTDTDYIARCYLSEQNQNIKTITTIAEEPLPTKLTKPFYILPY